MTAPTVKAHFIDEVDGLFSKEHLTHIPRVGDELRWAGPAYYRVTLVVWVFDEPDCPMQRVNIGMKKLESAE